jgi:hypothetical protein
MNSALVEFQDGYQVVTLRNALRRRPPFVVCVSGDRYLEGFGGSRHGNYPYYTRDCREAERYDDLASANRAMALVRLFLSKLAVRSYYEFAQSLPNTE